MKKEINFHINNLLKHGVDIYEVEEALLDGWKCRKREGDCYEILGCTDDGRYLQIVLEDRSNEIWVFHARDMNQREKKRYNKE